MLISKQNPIRRYPARKIRDFSDRLLGQTAIAVPDSFVAGATVTPGEWSAVPETSTWVMMAVGFAGLGYLGLRKTRTLGSVAPSLG